MAFSVLAVSVNELPGLHRSDLCKCPCFNVSSGAVLALDRRSQPIRAFGSHGSFEAMERLLGRSEPFGKLKQDLSRDLRRTASQQQSAWRSSHGKNWRFWTYAWWISLAVVMLAPAAITWTCDLRSAWVNLGGTIDELVHFPDQHRIAVPREELSETSMRHLDTSIVEWQNAMALLYRWTLDNTPVDDVSDSTLDIEYRASQIVNGAVLVREARIAVALRIKALNDALQAALRAFWVSHMEFALLPMASKPVTLGQQQLCMQKLDMVFDAWERIKLGQTMRIPFTASQYMTLSLSVIFSLIAATTVRCLESVVGGFYPQLPR
ncbi:hypothetical protein WJX73_001838 [Symbiochloris irregularis]|uniref:Uncharacterized protein n=1 Tax=Symbiochloris irregularis TaxID=706552 RepID=A0AAW1PHU9_9CHLO